MRVVIIEDEAPAFRRLQRSLEKLDESIEIIEVLDTVKESVLWLQKGIPVDLIFMDIQLADGLSFEIFERLEVNTPVVFTTAYDEYTLKAFKVNSIDYLLKPIDEALLDQSLNKWKKLRENYSQPIDLNRILQGIQPEEKTYKNRFLVRSRDQLISIKSEDIAYFYTDSGTVYLRTHDEQKFWLDQALDLIEAKLNPASFYRLNRQYIGNIEAIKTTLAYDKGKLMVDLYPKSERPVLVSREKASDFKRWLDME
jgi:DNA-binding LytR/AlgR family response regulator